VPRNRKGQPLKNKKEREKMKTTKKDAVAPNLNSLFIEGRLWFDKTGGNTYHAVRIEANGKVIHQIPITYGYENAYQYTALKWLQDYGLVSEDIKSIWELRGLIDIYFTSYYTPKRELWKAETVQEKYGKLLFIEELKGRNK
jgi:hypothetical protein